MPPRRSAKSAIAPLIGIWLNSDNRFAREVVRGIVRFAREHRRWRLIFDNPTGPRPDLLVGTKCDAVIGALSPDRVKRLRPTTRVLVNVSSRTLSPGSTRICLDDHAIGAMAAEQLASKGFRSLASIGVKGDEVSARRHAGFDAAATARGIATPQAILYGSIEPREPNPLSWAGLGKELRRLPKPVGILCAYDELGRTVSQCCWEHGVDVPEQASIIGVDNDDAICDSTIPPLSSIETGAWRLGYEAAALVHHVLTGGSQQAVPDRMLAPIHVVERASSAAFAIDDPDLAAALRYIHEHAIDGIGVHDVLDQLAINRRKLERLFRQSLRRTPHDEILRIRLEHAQVLLDQTKLPIKDVARRSGFVNLETFYRAFTRMLHTTPKAYRSRASVAPA